MIVKTTDESISNFLDIYSNWSYENNKLHCVFQFSDFNEAFGFISQIALLAEKQNHHPEIFNLYNRVVIDLTTHEANGVTERDFEFVRSIEKILNQQN